VSDVPSVGQQLGARPGPRHGTIGPQQEYPALPPWQLLLKLLVLVLLLLSLLLLLLLLLTQVNLSLQLRHQGGIPLVE
jgi:hypothetical protein